MESKLIQTGSFKTGYYEDGKGETVILIHGGGAGADSYGNWKIAFPLYAKHMHTIAMDMVGFGTSDAPSPAEFLYSQGARNDQAISFIEALKLGPVHIIGNSMGGATALGVAMKRPDLVKSMVLMGSAGLNRDLNTALAPVINYDYTLDGMRKIVGVLANPKLAMPEEMLNYRYKLSLEEGKRQAYGATMGWVKAQGGLHYEESEIAAVKTRTLVFAGKDDRVIPMREAFRFLELMENSHGYFLPNCCHWPMIEYPEFFVNLTLDFLLNNNH